MIDAHIFRFNKKIVFYVVATEEVINDLCTYADRHHKSNDFHFMDFMKRIRFHDAYCYITTNYWFYELFAICFRRELSKGGRLITFDQYLEAYCIAHPDEACSILPFERDELIYVVRDNPWFSIFEADESDVLRRMLYS